MLKIWKGPPYDQPMEKTENSKYLFLPWLFFSIEAGPWASRIKKLMYSKNKVLLLCLISVRLK